MSKIIIIEDSSISDLGGGQRVTIEAIQCFKKNEKSIYLYDLGAGKRFSENISRLDIYSRYFGIRSKVGFIFKIPFIISIISKEIKQKESVYIYATAKKSLIISSLIKLFCNNVTIIFHQHARTSIITYLFRKFADKIIVPGTNVRNRDTKTIVLSNPVNVIKNKYINRRKSRDKIVIGYIGSLTRKKGFELFIDYIKINNHGAIVAGEGPLENIIQNVNNVKYYGYVDDVSKKEFYNELDILVFPSIVHEPFSLVCFEAIFNHCPIVCFDLGYPSIIVKKYSVGIVVESITARSLGDAIEECANKIEKLSYNCQLVIDDFDNDSFCERLLSIFS